MTEAKAVTENQIDISNFSAELAAKNVAIIKPDVLSGNYIYYKVTREAKIVNGEAVMVVGAPIQANLNRESIASIRAHVASQVAAWNALAAQCDAVEAEMDKQDNLLVG